MTLVVTYVCSEGVSAAVTELGISGGIRANAGRALLKMSSVVVYIWYLVSMNLPLGVFSLVGTADSSVSTE